METLQALDGNILLFIQENIRQDWLTPIMKVITFLGNDGIFFIVLSIVFLLFRRTRKIGVIAASGLLMSYLVNNVILKNLVARTRPYEVIEGLTYLVEKPHDLSFPSGHAAVSFVIAVILFRRLPKTIGIPAFVLAVLVSLSRLYLGVHYPTDVLVGALSGSVLAYLADRYIGGYFGKKGLLQEEKK